MINECKYVCRHNIKVELRQQKSLKTIWKKSRVKKLTLRTYTDSRTQNVNNYDGLVKPFGVQKGMGIFCLKMQ